MTLPTSFAQLAQIETANQARRKAKEKSNGYEQDTQVRASSSLMTWRMGQSKR